MIDLTLLITYLITICIILGSPGPTTLLVINISGKNSVVAGLFTIVGTMVASLILMAISFTMIKGILAISEQTIAWLAFIGSIYLLYLAYTIAHASFRQSPVKKGHSSSQYFFMGFVTGMLNPKYILFFMIFFPSFMTLLPNLMHSFFTLATLWIMVGGTILSIYAIIFSKQIPYKLTHIINKFSGILLCCIAFFSLYNNSIFLWTSYQ